MFNDIQVRKIGCVGSGLRRKRVTAFFCIYGQQSFHGSFKHIKLTKSMATLTKISLTFKRP